MRDYLEELVRKSKNKNDGRNITREFLQARILASLQRSKAMIPLAFHSGTALRFLFLHGRFSEDLYFALEKSKDFCNFRDYLKSIQSDLRLEGYNISL